MAHIYEDFVGMGYTGSWYIDDDLKCTTDEEYKTDPQVVGRATQMYEGVDMGFDYDEVSMTEGNRACFYIRPNPVTPTTTQLTSYGLPNANRPGFIVSYDQSIQETVPHYRINEIYGPIVETTISTNLPIFEEEQYATAYVSALTSDEDAKTLIREHAINFDEGDVSPVGDDFEIVIQWTTSTWTSDRQPTVSSQPNLQGLRGKIVDGHFALYNIRGIDDGKLKMGIKSNATFYGLQYMNESGQWVDTVSIPYSFLYRRRKNELGTFSYALSVGTQNVPVFKDEDDADDFIDDIIPISEAENWDQISPSWPDVPTPGTPVSETEFGEVGARSIFSQQYVVPLAVMYEIANTFYDTTTAGLWDDIKKGLQMYGDSPIEAIENLSYYPCSLSSIFPGANQGYIYFGGYQMNLSQGQVYKLANPDGDVDVGSTFFRRPRNNWMDFEPYCKLFVNLPYCGEYQLDLSEYYNKTLAVKYFIDTRTGSCCCVLTADGVMVDKFNGQMGVQMPIKLTDFSAYANAQIQTLLGMGGQAAQNTGNIAQAASAGVSGGAAGAAVAGAGALAAGMGGVIGAKTVYGLAQNNINRFAKTKGGSTSMLNMYMPQKVTFTFEMNIPDIPSNFYALNGYPSNASGYVGNFNGYLRCDTVKLNMPGATDLEYEKARGLLLSGVYL